MYVYVYYNVLYSSRILYYSLPISTYSMPDKAKFVKELVRVTAPGGRIIVVTWCHRELGEGQTGLAQWEKGLLQKINDGICLCVYM